MVTGCWRWHPLRLLRLQHPRHPRHQPKPSLVAKPHKTRATFTRRNPTPNLNRSKVESSSSENKPKRKVVTKTYWHAFQVHFTEHRRNPKRYETVPKKTNCSTQDQTPIPTCSRCHLSPGLLDMTSWLIMLKCIMLEWLKVDIAYGSPTVSVICQPVAELHNDHKTRYHLTVCRCTTMSSRQVVSSTSQHEVSREIQTLMDNPMHCNAPGLW